MSPPCPPMMGHLKVHAVIHSRIKATLVINSLPYTNSFKVSEWYTAACLKDDDGTCKEAVTSFIWRGPRDIDDGFIGSQLQLKYLHDVQRHVLKMMMVYLRRWCQASYETEGGPRDSKTLKMTWFRKDVIIYNNVNKHQVLTFTWCKQGWQLMRDNQLRGTSSSAHNCHWLTFIVGDITLT